MRQVYARLLRLSAPELMLVPIDPFFSFFAGRYGGFFFWAGCDKKKRELMQVRSG